MKANILFCAIIMAIFFNSCIDVDSDEPQFYVDAYVISQVIDNDTLYAIEAQLQCSQAISSASISCSLWDTDAVMENISVDNTIYGYSQDSSGYQKTIPQAASYVFTIKLADGTSYTKTESVKASALAPFEISDITPIYSGAMMFSWPDIEYADYYSVRLIKNDTIVYNSGIIENTNSLTVSKSNSGWYDSSNLIEDGDSAKVYVFAIMAESYIYNNVVKIQSMSYSDVKSFVWGE